MISTEVKQPVIDKSLYLASILLAMEFVCQV